MRVSSRGDPVIAPCLPSIPIAFLVVAPCLSLSLVAFSLSRALVAPSPSRVLPVGVIPLRLVNRPRGGPCCRAVYAKLDLHTRGSCLSVLLCATPFCWMGLSRPLVKLSCLPRLYAHTHSSRCLLVKNRDVVNLPEAPHVVLIPSCLLSLYQSLLLLHLSRRAIQTRASCCSLCMLTIILRCSSMSTACLPSKFSLTLRYAALQPSLGILLYCRPPDRS